MVDIDYFNLDKHYFNEDALSFTFNLNADLTPLYNWNTNMLLVSLVCSFDADAITVWDQRILRTDTAHHTLALTREHVEYYLTDVNRRLAGKEVTVSLRWEHMSTVGPYYADSVEVAKFTTPAQYNTKGKRQY